MEQDQSQVKASDPQQRFSELYNSGNTPWDTGISPPELLSILTGPSALLPGRALDIGCGTGTNSLTLARHGWDVLGVDFAQQAIALAQAKATNELDLIAHAGGSVRFLCSDVTGLAVPLPEYRYTLLFDLGCLSGVPFSLRSAYARMVSSSAADGALFLLYTHMPRSDGRGALGCTPAEIDTLFATAFTLECHSFGENPQGGMSMWSWLRQRKSE